MCGIEICYVISARRQRPTGAAGGRYPDYPADGLLQASKRWSLKAEYGRRTPRGTINTRRRDQTVDVARHPAEHFTVPHYGSLIAVIVPGVCEAPRAMADGIRVQSAPDHATASLASPQRLR
jgi:hypothetical protein